MPSPFWIGIVVLAILFHVSFLNDLINRVVASRKALENLSKQSQEQSKRQMEELRAWRSDNLKELEVIRKRREEHRLFQKEQVQRSEEMVGLNREQLAVLKELAARLAPEQTAETKSEPAAATPKRRPAKPKPENA